MRGLAERRYAWVLTCIALTASLVACGTGASSSAVTPTTNTSSTQPRTVQPVKKSLPHGPIPAGWKVYQGTSVPFAVAYPPGWKVDATNAPVGEISFVREAGKRSVELTITTRDTPGPVRNLTVLRSQLVRNTTAACDMGRRIQKMGKERFAGVPFATATATCAPEEEGSGEHGHGMELYMGAAMKNGVEWTFAYHSGTANFATNLHTYVMPMLRTLNIYAHA